MQKIEISIIILAVLSMFSCDKAQLRTFYTAMFHTMVYPSLFNDADGSYLRSFITHKDILKGGLLEFEMGATPNNKILAPFRRTGRNLLCIKILRK